MELVCDTKEAFGRQIRAGKPAFSLRLPARILSGPFVNSHEPETQSPNSSAYASKIGTSPLPKQLTKKSGMSAEL